ncbi:alpha/beta hydrolase [Streptomyces sp. NPDC051018]|uniref:alpha/beta hydrolase n=1 Tax=Streptomyces sp. NPDC051018 TaxID=3365639 RepID=UPI0037B96CF9
MSMRVRAGALATAALLLAGTAAGCTTDPDEGEGKGGAASSSPSAPAKETPGASALPAALTGQKLDWKSCRPPVKADGIYAEKPGRQWQCATMKAPLDYGKPSGETMGIALIRAKAKDDGSRIGSLLFNFGGPGGSGVATLPRAAEDYQKLNRRYDLVGFDPRGVADSSAVVCRDSEQTEASHQLDHSPDTAAEEKIFLDNAAAFGAGCAKRSGKLLPHVGTENAARDMDLMRQVLGDDKLHYLGFSYGTELGAVYAHLFPSEVGRLVLDAVVDPTTDFAGGSRNQAVGFQRALENYFKDRGIGAEEGTARVVKLLERLDREPLPAGEGRKLTENLALTGIVLPLYSQESWSTLTEALDAAESGDGAPLIQLADMYNSRDENGDFTTQDHSQRAISCTDAGGATATPAEVTSRHLPEFTKISPVFGPMLAWDLAGWCAGWPVTGDSGPTDVSAKGAAPILVIGTTGDPATPYEGAKKMADGLGAGVGVLITNKGEGHGAYGTADCVTKTVDAYLLDGTVPPNGKTCS